MVEVQKYVPAALLSLQCDLESYRVLIELLSPLLLNIGFHLSYISLPVLVFLGS
jgi:hypothetical protein